jgi:hypothetical protein
LKKETTTMTDQSTTQQQLAAANHKLANLEQRREMLTREHGAAVEERRKALLGDSDVKTLSRADDRVAAAEGSLEGVDDALVSIRKTISGLSDQLADEADHAAREQEATFVHQSLAALERAALEYAATAEKFAAAFAPVAGERSAEANPAPRHCRGYSRQCSADDEGNHGRPPSLHPRSATRTAAAGPPHRHSKARSATDGAAGWSAVGHKIQAARICIARAGELTMREPPRMWSGDRRSWFDHRPEPRRAPWELGWMPPQSPRLRLRERLRRWFRRKWKGLTQ